eukprot:1783195-Rhodomonas_salina.1
MASNLLTVTLKSNTELCGSDGSNVTLAGLTGTSTSQSNSFSINDVGCNVVAQQCATELFTTGALTWQPAAGSLILPLASGECLARDIKYIFSFTLTNGAIAQSARTVTISTSGTASFEAIMDPDMSSLLSVTGASRGDAAP